MPVMGLIPVLLQDSSAVTTTEVTSTSEDSGTASAGISSQPTLTAILAVVLFVTPILAFTLVVAAQYLWNTLKKRKAAIQDYDFLENKTIVFSIISSAAKQKRRKKRKTGRCRRLKCASRIHAKETILHI